MLVWHSLSREVYLSFTDFELDGFHAKSIIHVSISTSIHTFICTCNTHTHTHTHTHTEPRKSINSKSMNKYATPRRSKVNSTHACFSRKGINSLGYIPTPATSLWVPNLALQLNRVHYGVGRDLISHATVG
jgi:hypothetical protein